jgi:hypothetical protein
MSSPTRVVATPNRVLGLVVGAFVLVALAAVAFAAMRPTTTFAPGTPEAAVQGYLSAVLESDSEKAAGYLAPGSPCALGDLDRTGVAASARVSLVDSTTDSDTARVRVRVSYSSGDPFGGAESENQTFRLTRSAGTWRISGIPWPLFECGVNVK